MNNIVIGGAFVLLAVWYIVDIVRIRRQSFARAVARVERELAKPQPQGKPSLVQVWSAYPLSEHMMKRIAELGGFRFVDEQYYNGARALAFDPPKTPRRLSIHD